VPGGWDPQNEAKGLELNTKKGNFAVKGGRHGIQSAWGYTVELAKGIGAKWGANFRDDE